jgi:hypothetical protein
MVKNLDSLAVLLLIFNRPELTQQVFDVIKKVKPSRLFVSADGPRVDNSKDLILCQKTRDIVKQVDWECDVVTLFRKKNLGCRLAISSGISWFFDHVDEGVILEDDCLPSESFFSFSQKLLEKYRFDDQIMQINGSYHLSSVTSFRESYYFSKLNSCWGWATWKRAWKYFDPTMTGYLDSKKNKSIQDYYENIEISNWMISYFDEAYDPSCKIWSTQWSYAIFKNRGLCVNPTVNLVNNIGFLDAPTSGFHDSFLSYSDYILENIDTIVSLNEFAYDVENDILEFNNVIKLTDPRLLNHGLNGFIKGFFKKAFNFLSRKIRSLIKA